MAEQERMDEWCLVELMGHRRHAARVREVEIAGAGMLRLDEPGLDGTPGRTLHVSPSSVYALHPTTEEMVERMARTWRHEPVQRWELPAIEPAAVTDEDAADEAFFPDADEPWDVPS
jgi:hypothetical protein